MREKLLTMVAACAGFVGVSAANAGMTQVKVTIENLAPTNGTYQSPFWVGFHDGSFDMFDVGSSASTAIERLAEDANAAQLSADFLSSGVGALDGLVGGGPFGPGDVVSMTFSLDGNNPLARYFSYASMTVPSNDAFVANDNAMQHMIFDGAGNFIGADFFITGANVYDAGTEVNDEIPMNTAFFGQMMPNTGVDENGVIHMHEGYMGSFANPGLAAVLADPMFNGADFTLAGYPIARITITQVPAPGALALLGLAGCITRKRRRTQA